MSVPLRIGIACYPTFGGSGVIAAELGVSLALRGHSVHLISSDVPGRLDQDQVPGGVTFHKVEARDYPLFDEQVTYPLALASKMAELGRRERLDLFHVHYAIPHATSAYLARQLLGPGAPKLVTTLHGTDVTLVGSDPGHLPITRFSIMQSDGVTAPSSYLQKATYELLGVPASMPIEVIPNFVDTNRFRPAERTRHRGPEPVLVHVSNFRPVKRVEDVIGILAEVRRKLPARLVLVGDGPERPRVEALVDELGLAPHVRFLGARQDVVEVLRDSDVFLLPSELESFGLAALEALACGVPVVASDTGGVPEVITHGEVGFLAPVGDVAGMAAAVVKLLSDAALHERMSRAARRQVEERWRMEPMIERYEACYRRVLGA